MQLVNLENQVGDAVVLAAGHLFGNSVVTLHTLREAGALREYLVIYGHLESIAPGISHGQTLKADSLLGYVGDSDSPGIVHLHFEVRRAREGVDVGSTAARSDHAEREDRGLRSAQRARVATLSKRAAATNRPGTRSPICGTRATGEASRASSD